VKLRLLLIHANSYEAKYFNAIMTLKIRLLMMNRNPKKREINNK